MDESWTTWLLEKNTPSVRYVTLRDIISSTSDKELLSAKADAYEKGSIGEVLAHMNKDGYWVKLGGGYNPKYTSSVWALILLSQLGARVEDDPRIALACRYYLDHALSKNVSISYNGTPSGTFPCLQGNMCRALNVMGCADPRLQETCEWMARSVIGDEIQYYAYNCGPNFACGANGKKPCAWGAVKIVLALGSIPVNKRTQKMKKAITMGVDFLLDGDPMKANYPTRSNTRPSRDWWKFGFPLFYVTDILQIAEAVTDAGFGQDTRLKETIAYIESKKNSLGRWLLEYDYAGKTWGDFGEKGKPNKWVTYRAHKLLKAIRTS